MFKLFSKLRPVLAAAVLGLAVQATPAAANPFNVINVGSLDSASPYANFVSHQGSFLDMFTFSLAVESDISASVAALDLSLGHFNIFNIDNLHLGLFSLSAPTTLLASGTTALSFDDLDAGNYFIGVIGDANGAFGGGYLFGLAASPAPEPEQWMLFAAGLLAVGSMVRRRS